MLAELGEVEPVEPLAAGGADPSVAAWRESQAVIVDHYVEEWMLQKDADKDERAAARAMRREAREKRRSRRRQAVLAKRFAHKKAIMQRRLDQKNDDTRVIKAGGGVDNRNT